MAGLLKESDLTSGATNIIHDAKARKEQLCDAHFYIAMKHLIAADTNSALANLSDCLNRGMPDYGSEGFDEYLSAQAMLKRIK
jgi:hypothetical protein